MGINIYQLQYRQNLFDQGLHVFFSQISAPTLWKAQRWANNNIKIEKQWTKTTKQLNYTVSDDTN